MSASSDANTRLVASFVDAHTDYEKSFQKPEGRYNATRPLYVLMGGPGAGKSLFVDRLLSKASPQTFCNSNSMQSGLASNSIPSKEVLEGGRAASGLFGTVIPVVRQVPNSDLQVCDMPGHSDVHVDRRATIEILQRCLMGVVTGETYFIIVLRAFELKDPRGLEVSQCFEELRKLMGNDVMHYIPRMFFLLTQIDRSDMKPEDVQEAIGELNFSVAGFASHVPGAAYGGFNQFVNRIMNFNFVVDYRTMTPDDIVVGLNRMFKSHSGQEGLSSGVRRLPYSDVKDLSDTVLNSTCDTLLRNFVQSVQQGELFVTDCGNNLRNMADSVQSAAEEYRLQLQQNQGSVEKRVGEKKCTESILATQQLQLKSLKDNIQVVDAQLKASDEQYKALSQQQFQNIACVKSTTFLSIPDGQQHFVKAIIGRVQRKDLWYVAVQYEDKDTTLRNLFKNDQLAVPKSVGDLAKLPRNPAIFFNSACPGAYEATVDIEEDSRGLKIKVKCRYPFKLHLFSQSTMTGAESQRFLTDALVGSMGAKRQEFDRLTAEKKALEARIVMQTKLSADAQAKLEDQNCTLEVTKEKLQEFADFVTGQKTACAQVRTSMAQRHRTLTQDVALDLITKVKDICQKNGFKTSFTEGLASVRQRLTEMKARIEILDARNEECTKAHEATLTELRAAVAAKGKQ